MVKELRFAELVVPWSQGEEERLLKAPQTAARTKMTAGPGDVGGAFASVAMVADPVHWGGSVRGALRAGGEPGGVPPPADELDFGLFMDPLGGLLNTLLGGEGQVRAVAANEASRPCHPDLPSHVRPQRSREISC